jgi:O-antigen/teichoic acid export membrane protein
MRLAAFFPKRKQSSNAEHALVYLCFHGPFCIGYILISEGSLIGAGIILCWAAFLVLIIRRELKHELIADHCEPGSSRALLLGAVPVLIFASAYLHERWIVITLIAALIVAALITVISALVLLPRAMKRI